MQNFFDKLLEHEEMVEVDNMFLAAKNFTTTLDLGVHCFNDEELKRGKDIILDDGDRYIIKYVEWNNALIEGEVGVLVENCVG